MLKLVQLTLVALKYEQEMQIIDWPKSIIPESLLKSDHSKTLGFCPKIYTT